MSYRGSELSSFDFSGGLASNKPSSNIDGNEAQALQNVVITVGKGIKKKNGNTLFNASAMSSGAAVTGLFYYKQSGGSQFLIATSGSKIFESSALNGTMTDITGAVTITSNANNLWTATQMNDLAIFVGGAPDAPIKYSGSGNAAALGGSPPTGNFGFSHNNRMFIGNTSANPSLIQWSILSDPEDWSSSGSGSQQIEKNDGDVLVGAAPLNTDTVLLFKQNSIHQFITRTSPFPYFPLFKGTGAVGKRAIVVSKGLVYFITPSARMAITDGSKILDERDLPRLGNIDDQWDALSTSRLPYITGICQSGKGFDHILWFVSSASASTNDLAFVWDIRHQCWLKHTSGYKANSAALTQSGTLYTGHYDGKIYLQDVSSATSDASETSPGAVDARWYGNWKTVGSLSESFHGFRLNVALTSQTSGNLSIGYGYDYASDRYIETRSMQATGAKWDEFLWDEGVLGTQTDQIKNIFTKGRGANMQISFRNAQAAETFAIHGYNILVKKSGQKSFDIA